MRRVACVALDMGLMDARALCDLLQVCRKCFVMCSFVMFCHSPELFTEQR